MHANLDYDLPAPIEKQVHFCPRSVKICQRTALSWWNFQLIEAKSPGVPFAVEAK